MPKTRRASTGCPRRPVQGREQAIEDLLFAYPYLLEPVFERLQRQVWLNPASRLDLLFESAQELVVIEIKRGPCGTAEVRQLERYLHSLAQRGKPVRGILVGASITAVATRHCEESLFAIAFRQTGVDVPTRVVVCRECRRARCASQTRCARDGSRETLVLA
ncbi:MAG: DUF91 domain-containing protein [Rhodospirillales bacterium]|nr:DUF91 domain-containing protein [Acetobacter sp.]